MSMADLIKFIKTSINIINYNSSSNNESISMQ